MSENNLNKHKIICLLSSEEKKPIYKQMDNVNDGKQKIIQLFMDNVKGKQIDLSNMNKSHDGKEGHWLETQMNITHNSKNKADIYGYEMKKKSPKITFGDFSATEYLFTLKKKYINEYNITRNDFIRYFGSIKKERFSWSGKCVPVYGKYNEYGQILEITKDNDICIFYSYIHDKREDKNYILPDFLKSNPILIVLWKAEKLRNNINNKFNDNGFFICKKNGSVYDKICFGNPFNFDYFIENIKNKLIIFDSGMYEGNSRNYSQFRSSSNFWDKMITEEY